MFNLLYICTSFNRSFLYLMPQSLSRVFVHIVFSTKHRQPFMDLAIQPRLFAYMARICTEFDCPPVRIGGYYDHVHILCLLSRKTTLADLLEDVKKHSSKWVKTQGEQYANFYWQNGYGAFSVNPKQEGVVCRYIDNQFFHHEKKDFKTEFREFLHQYEVEYDERYVWD